MSLERDAITIRAIKANDWHDLHEIWTDPRVCRGLLQVPYQSEDEIRKKVENQQEGAFRLVAEVDGRVVGVCGLRLGRSPRVKHGGYLGISVHPEHWNEGIGSALMDAIVDLSDNWLGLKRIELQVYTDNGAAIHLYEKFGFVIEGTKRRYALRDGEYVDAHIMARVRD
jgi:putative acetyltransferase